MFRRECTLSPEAKAKRRAKRNARGIKTPDGEYKRYFAFQRANGAKPGRRGDKVYGRPFQSHRAFGVFPGSPNDRTLRGRSAAGINAEWALRHTVAGWRDQCLRQAIDLHARKLAELRAMPAPKLPGGAQ